MIDRKCDLKVRVNYTLGMAFIPILDLDNEISTFGYPLGLNFQESCWEVVALLSECLRQN